MSKIFYDHLVIREEVIAELDKHEVDSDSREELVRHIDAVLHHHVLDVILSHLPSEKHEKFLTAFHASPHDEKLLEYLKSEVEEDIEEKIKVEAEKVKKELLAEIKRAKK